MPTEPPSNGSAEAQDTIQDAATLRDRFGEPSPFVVSKVADTVGDFEREYIANSPFLVLTTADAEGRLDASPKGDAPGFVAVPDEKTLLIPDRKGNKLVFGLNNILENPRVGILFMIPGTEDTLRINGRAEISEDPSLKSQLAARGQDALVVIRVHVEECFFHCAKAFRRSSLWDPKTWADPPYKLSTGAHFAKRINREGDRELIEKVDAALEENLKNEL